MKKRIPLLLLGWLTLNVAMAQETFPRNDVQDTRTHAYAFTHAHLVIDHQTTIENGTLLIRNGKIERTGTNLSVPPGYTVVDLEGKYVYPSLIDMHTTYALKAAERGPNSGREQIQSIEAGPYNANEAIKSAYDAYSSFEIDPKAAADFRSAGFGTVLAFRPDGLARGSSALVTLGESSENEVMIKSQAAAHFSFDKGSSRQMYPSSPMGYVALLRQTYLDAAWYQAQDPRPFTDKSLDAWLALQDLPQIFSTDNWSSVLRADKLGDEFGVQYILKGGGDEYQRIEAVKATGASMIIPVNFPDAYDVADPIDAYEVSFRDMKHWELAPTNLSYVEGAGIDFALTTDGLKKKGDFLPNLRTAIQHGLSEEAALKALTYTPATLLRAEDQIGSLKTGRWANFIICSSSLFAEDLKIYENWVQGRPFILQETELPDLRANYELSVGTNTYRLEISGQPGKPAAKILINDSTTQKVDISSEEGVLTLGFPSDLSEKSSPQVRLSGWQNGRNIQGQGQLGDGSWNAWVARFESELEKKEEEGSDQSPQAEEVGPILYPFSAYGNTEVPQQENILIKNATVWTMANGKLENTDVRIEDGKIKAIGQNLSERNARVIDGTGKHLTPGIIDEHSHIAAYSINDVATNSSMVRIGDVIYADDLDIYHALSGGVTTIQILHGSANPIGGQSALIKLRWGMGPEQLKVEGADGFIKFALGENVKRSWSSNSIRYPQTRMGVEQVFVDAFTTAQDYQRTWEAYNRLSPAEKSTTPAPRKDLVLDAMAEILNSERFISCHSYVQSEINMLMNVAERFGFRVNTFTHILEGYKVADKMAEHGVGGSTFSDWWNYKWEVRYAIPYNPAIMHREGVVTAINSDDAEMMRRLNQEAAKSVKYGGMSEEDALAMVTLNPAKLLHLDDRVGTIETGKDGDVVLWSDHPLSIYARAEKTIIDGTVFFDIEQDQEKKAEIVAERARLIQKMKDAQAQGGRTQPAARRQSIDLHCEDVFIHREH